MMMINLQYLKVKVKYCNLHTPINLKLARNGLVRKYAQYVLLLSTSIYAVSGDANLTHSSSFHPMKSHLSDTLSVRCT